MIESEAQKQWRANAPKKIVAVKLVITSNQGNVLLVRPTYKPTWQFPGGGVEMNESPVDALCRELYEELGLRITESDVRSAGVAFQPKDDSVLLIYELTHTVPEDIELELQHEELESYTFVEPMKVPGMISEHYRAFWAAR